MSTLNGDQMTRKNGDGMYLKRDRLLCDRWSFEGSAESVKAYMDSIVKKAKEKGMLGDGKFAFYPVAVYCEEGEREYELDVYYEFDRAETEKEKQKREKAEAKLKEAAAARRKAAAEKKKMKADAEYAEYLRLKKKFKESSE